MRLSARLLVLRAGRLLRGADRERRVALDQQFSQYTPAQRRDLAATLDRYPDSATGELRETLSRLDRAGPFRGGWSLRI